MSLPNLISYNELQSLQNRCDLNYFEGKNILVTGGAGMLGSWLASAILLCGTDSRELRPHVDVVSQRSNPINLAQVSELSNFRYLRGNVLESKWKEYDLIIHAASIASPTKYMAFNQILETNVKPIQQLIEASPKLDQFMFISSGEVYGTSTPVNVEENFSGSFNDSLTRAVYPRAKIEAEKSLMGIAAHNSFSPAIARLFHTFGPGVARDDGRSFADFIWSGARGMPPELLSSGKQIRAFLYLEDAVAGILKIITSRTESPINVGSDEAISIREMADKVSHVAGVESPSQSTQFVPNYEQSPNDLCVPSNSALRQLGWTQEVLLEEGILRTLQWCRELLACS